MGRRRRRCRQRRRRRRRAVNGAAATAAAANGAAATAAAAVNGDDDEASRRALAAASEHAADRIAAAESALAASAAARAAVGGPGVGEQVFDVEALAALASAERAAERQGAPPFGQPEVRMYVDPDRYMTPSELEAAVIHPAGVRRVVAVVAVGARESRVALHSWSDAYAVLCYCEREGQRRVGVRCRPGIVDGVPLTKMQMGRLAKVEQDQAIEEEAAAAEAERRALSAASPPQWREVRSPRWQRSPLNGLLSPRGKRAAEQGVGAL